MCEDRRESWDNDDYVFLIVMLIVMLEVSKRDLDKLNELKDGV